MVKASQWGDKIPIGILYREESLSFTDRIDGLKEGPLTERAYDPARLKKLLAEF
jgi:2-oxoglutarate ferredoxin oxidoreductase subunit beta